MPPKAAAAAPATPPPDVIQEEEEEGEGKAAFRLELQGVSNLPIPLETKVVFSGLCNENETGPAESSENPSEYELPKGKFIRAQTQGLYDDMVSKDLCVKVLDVGNDNAEIGRASISCLPLLHQRLEVGGQLELKLTETYYKKWWPEAEEDAVDPKAKAKAKAKAAPEPTKVVEKKPERPPDFVPPATNIVVKVSVEKPVGPREDRQDWTVLQLACAGVFGMPERIAAGAAEDLEAHPFTYKAVLFGEELGKGELVAAAEVPPEPEQQAPDGGEENGEVEKQEDPVAAEEQLTEEEWREKQERFAVSVQFGREKPVACYRGKAFLDKFRHMLNYTGGVYMYLMLEERPPTDPKKPNPADAQALAKHFAGKAWFDLRKLLRVGVRAVEAPCALAGAAAPEDVVPDEASWQDARTFAKLSLRLRFDVAQPPPPPIADPRGLVPPRLQATRFPASHDAGAMYREVVQETFDAICRDCGSNTRGTAAVVDQLKKAGSYDDLRESMRAAVIRVFRERMRKDSSVVPGQPLEGTARDELLSNTYAYLKESAAKALDEVRSAMPAAATGTLGVVQEGPSSPAAYASEAFPADTSPAAEAAEVQIASRRTSRLPSKQSGLGEFSPSAAADGESVQLGAEVSSEFHSPIGAGRGVDPAAILAETPATSRARAGVDVAGDIDRRNSRLAFEAELGGNWPRAAELLHNRLLLEEVRSDPKEWVAYAKFCARARGRQAAAEEALRQAVQLIAEGAATDPEASVEVDTMLACLLLDRGRYEEAIRAFRELHEKDIGDPSLCVFYALSLFLRGEAPEQSKALFEAASKPRDWFNGITATSQIVDKLKAAAKSGSGAPRDVAPYAACLEKLLDFGLPSMVFTFLDQTGILSSDDLCREPFSLIDAKASALDRDFAAAVSRLEQLTGVTGASADLEASSGDDSISRAYIVAAQGTASQDAWRLLGDCYFQIGDMDRALQALNQALAFERKFEEPDVFIRLGSVLIAKKRWKQAREAFLKSIQFVPTAEAWTGVAYAEYRSDELQYSYEALCEATLLDKDRSDIWALLTLVHLKLYNGTQADHAFRQCLSLKADCEELLVEVAREYVNPGPLRQPTFAEAAARRAIDVRDSGMARGSLADALAAQEKFMEAIREAEAGMKLLVNNPEPRGMVFERALRWCEELNDKQLIDALQAVQTRCNEEASSLSP